MKVTVEEAADRIADLLQQVQHGVEVTIYDGEKPVATIRPADEALYSYRPATGQRFGDYHPEPVDVDFDPLEFLMEERRKR
jgi:antitoxin (DNA-binding transcriptional repressor) of toxin-antitoxin stability system